MACISAPVIGGAISGVGSLASGLFGSSAATSAAQVQAAAARQAAQLQYQEFQQVQGNLAPFTAAGTNALASLENLTGITGTGTSYAGNPLTAPLTGLSPAASGIQTSFAPTEASLVATPGYQFNLTQGLKATQNALASQGLGRSGAAAVGAGKYASGLADTTYQNQFANWYNQQQLGLQNWLTQNNFNLAQKQQLYNMLGGITTTGESAAAGAGSLGIQSAAQIGNTLTSGAAATAGGIVGSANALSAGLSGAGGAASNTALLLALQNSGMFGPGTGAGGPAWGGGPGAAGYSLE